MSYKLDQKTDANEETRSAAANSACDPMVYQIRVEGHLGNEWADWFDGLTITLENNDTLLSGRVVDQAALYGLLRKVRDLGLPLISVNRLQSNRDRTQIQA